MIPIWLDFGPNKVTLIGGIVGVILGGIIGLMGGDFLPGIFIGFVIGAVVGGWIKENWPQER